MSRIPDSASIILLRKNDGEEWTLSGAYATREKAEDIAREIRKLNSEVQVSVGEYVPAKNKLSIV